MGNPLYLVLLLVVIVGLVAAGSLLALRARKWARGELNSGRREQLFTLQDLREMRARGEINEVEYQSLRATVVGQAGGATPRDYGGAAHLARPPRDDGPADR